MAQLLEAANLGIQMAQREQKLKQDEETFMERRKAVTAQQLELVYGKYMTAMRSPKPVQKAAFDHADRIAATFDMQAGPQISALMKDPENQQGVLSIMSAASGMPEAQIQGLAFLKDNNLEALYPLLEQAKSGQMKQAQLGLEQQKYTDSLVGQAKDRLRQGLATGERLVTLQKANSIVALLRDPNTSKDAFATESAKTLFASFLDARSAVKEEEIKRINNIAPGLWDRLDGYVQRLTSGQGLTGPQRQQLLQAVDIIATAVDDEVGVATASERGFLKRRGVAGEDLSTFDDFVTRYRGGATEKGMVNTMMRRVEDLVDAGMSKQDAVARVRQVYARELRYYHAQRQRSTVDGEQQTQPAQAAPGGVPTAQRRPSGRFNLGDAYNERQVAKRAAQPQTTADATEE